MARSVPKCKRAAYVYDRDFIVVDDISGVLKMRSECAIDGYGFLSSQGDIRNPQEIPPIIREQMAAWPDPRPIGQPVFTPEPDYQYFLFNYFVSDVADDSSTFDATASVGLNAPIASIAWSVDGVYVTTGLTALLTMIAGAHDISVLLTDLYGNEQTFAFEYTQPIYLGLALYHFNSNFDDSSGNNYNLSGNAVISSAQSKFGGSSASFYVSESVSSSVDAIPPFAGSDFTVEFWMYYVRGENIFDAAAENLVGFLPSSLPSERLMIRLDSSIGGTLQVEMVGGSTTSGFITTSITKTNLRDRWAHIALVRQGTSFKLYVDGTLAGSVTYSASFAIQSTLTIGKLPSGTNYYRGFIDELRISDIAVYTANFTPPTSPF